MNCGACGKVCAAGEACAPSLGGDGSAIAICQPAACALADDSVNCCGQTVCGPNQVCCNASGDVTPNPPFTCVDLDAGACPAQCFCA
jgi:hypothetical protein